MFTLFYFLSLIFLYMLNYINSMYETDLIDHTLTCKRLNIFLLYIGDIFFTCFQPTFFKSIIIIIPLIWVSSSFSLLSWRNKKTRLLIKLLWCLWHVLQTVLLQRKLKSLHSHDTCVALDSVTAKETQISTVMSF